MRKRSFRKDFESNSLSMETRFIQTDWFSVFICPLTCFPTIYSVNSKRVYVPCTKCFVDQAIFMTLVTYLANSQSNALQKELSCFVCSSGFYCSVTHHKSSKVYGNKTTTIIATKQSYGTYVGMTTCMSLSPADMNVYCLSFENLSNSKSARMTQNMLY